MIPYRHLFLIWALIACGRAHAQAPAPAPAPASPIPPPLLTASAFSENLQTLANTAPGMCGIAIRDLKSGEEFSVHSDQLFSQAGLSKLHLLAALIRESAAGRVDLGTPHTLAEEDKLPGGILQRLGAGTVTMSLRDYATLMVAIDDNTAAGILLKRLGLAAVKDTITVLGAQDVHFAGLTTDPAKPEDNTASPRGILHCLVALHEGPVLDAKARAELFDLLSTPRQGAIRAGVPRDVKVASKSGIRGPLRNSAAIVFLKNHPYAIVVMTQWPKSDDPAAGNDPTRLITDISKLAYDHFSRLGTPAAAHPLPPPAVAPP